jgi:hypothetical protein
MKIIEVESLNDNDKGNIIKVDLDDDLVSLLVYPNGGFYEYFINVNTRKYKISSEDAIKIMDGFFEKNVKKISKK